MDKNDAAHGLPERLDYDNLFKTILRRYFWEALELFLPELYEAADRAAEPEFLEQELQKVTFDLEGGANQADLLTRIKLKSGANELILCHMEVQGEGGGDLPARMHRYRQMIYLKHEEEPIGIAVITAPRPKKEASSYLWERFRVKVSYEYINVDVMKLDDNVLLGNESRIGLVLYAAKCAALSGGNESEKFRYLRILSELWAERGWDKDDKRIILRAIEYLINLKDENYARDISAYVKSMKMKEDDKEMYVSVFEKVYKEEGRIEGLLAGRVEGRSEGRAEGRSEGSLEIAKNMLLDGLPLEKISQYTNLPLEKIESLSVSNGGHESASPQ